MNNTDLEKLSIQAIRQYLNKNYSDEEIKEKYTLVIDIVKTNITNSLSINKSISSMTQGSRSVSYKNNDVIIDDFVKSLLPKPFIKLR